MRKPLFNETVRANKLWPHASACVTSTELPTFWLTSYPNQGRLIDVEVVGHYYYHSQLPLKIKTQIFTKGPSKSRPRRVFGHCTVFNEKFYAADIDPSVTISSQLSLRLQHGERTCDRALLQCRIWECPVSNKVETSSWNCTEKVERVSKIKNFPVVSH